MAAKRVANELKKFPQTMTDFNIDVELYELDGYDFYPPQNFGIFKNNKMIIRLDTSKEYPFRPPNVFVYDNKTIERYDSWSAAILGGSRNGDCNYFNAWAFSIIANPKLSVGWNFIPTIGCRECLCCKSITCSANWAASKLFSDILIEYIARRNFSINCSKLQQRWIKSIFDNDRWYVPDDLILYIIDMITN